MAIKILPPGVEKEDPSFAERFKSEAKLMAKLNHPAVVAVYDFGTTSAGQLRSDETPPAPKPAQGTERTTLPASPPKTAPKPAPAPVSSTPSLPASKSSDPQFPPGKWVKVFTQTEDLPAQFQKAGSGVRLKDGILEVDSISTYLGLALASGNMSNCAVRATMIGDSFNLRMRGDNAGKVSYLFKPTSIEVGRPAADGKPGDFPRLASFSAPPKTEQQWEFGAVGNSLITRRGGVIIGFATDARIKIGMPVLANFQGTLRDIEVINLDGLSEAEAFKILGVDEKGNDLRKPAAVASTSPAPSVSKSSASPASSSPSPPVSKSSDQKFPPGQWVKVFTKFEELPQELRKPDSGVKWEDGWIRKGNNDVALRVSEVPLKNAGVRARVRLDSESNNYSALSLRSSSAGRLTLSRDRTGPIQRLDWTTGKSGQRTLAAFDLGRSLMIGEHIVEFCVVGDRANCRFDDLSKVIQFSGDYATGAVSLGGSEDIRDIEVINLDGLSEAEALRILGVDEKGNDLRALAAKQEQQKAEQAKAVDAMAAIPELKALHEQFVKLQAERVTAPFVAEVAKLNAGYLGGIDREIANEKKAGHLDGVIALEAEKKLIQGMGHPAPRVPGGRRPPLLVPSLRKTTRRPLRRSKSCAASIVTPMRRSKPPVRRT